MKKIYENTFTWLKLIAVALVVIFVGVLLLDSKVYAVTYDRHTDISSAVAISYTNTEIENNANNDENTNGLLFKDLTPEHPYFDAIMQLHERGIISGNGNGLFRPDDRISIAEILTILETAYGDTDNLPNTWDEWTTAKQPFKGTWLDQAMLADCNLTTTAIIWNEACSWLLSIMRIDRLPMSLYNYPEDVAEMYCYSYGTVLLYGFSEPGGNVTPGNRFITRAEFCGLVAWSFDIVGTLPEQHIYLPVDVKIEVLGFNEGYQTGYNSLMLQDALMDLPLSVLKSFAENEYTVKLMANDYYCTYTMDMFGVNYNNTAGLYVHKSDTRGGEILLRNGSRMAVIHEFGHYVYFNLFDGQIAVGTTFKNTAEVAGVRKCVFSSYCETNEKEFFAEAYVAYIDRPEMLKENAPIIFGLIDAIFS